MRHPARNLQSDPTEKVDLTDPAAVLKAIDSILRARYGAEPVAPSLAQQVAEAWEGVAQSG